MEFLENKTINNIHDIQILFVKKLHINRFLREYKNNKF